MRLLSRISFPLFPGAVLSDHGARAGRFPAAETARYFFFGYKGAISMMILVHSAESEYEIILRNGALKDVGWLLPLDRRILIVTDDGVPPEYAAGVAAAAAHPTLVTLPHGEGSKTLENYQTLLKTMLSAGFTRGDAVVAVGGGMVGDLAGFTAATYMRGVDFFNIPTTLLAQVDSSIGGKTAVNLAGTKNSVGCFYAPSRVLIDPDTLKTLSFRDKKSGFAEIIKMAATSDAALFSLLENTDDPDAILPELIRRALLIKKQVVERDPKETGLRMVLNFGHTVGHAIESAAGGSLSHGECVALGMLPMCSPAVRSRIKALLSKFELPLTAPFSASVLSAYLQSDKKRAGDRISAVLVDEIGSFTFRKLLPEEILTRAERTGILRP